VQTIIVREFDWFFEKGVVDNDFDTCMFEVEDDADEDAYLDCDDISHQMMMK